MKTHRATNGKKLPTPKQKVFIKEYVKTLNGAKSARTAYPEVTEDSAKAIATENLSKPYIRREIESLLLSNGITKEEILAIHSRNMKQRKHLPTSQKAVESFEEMLGLSGQKESTGVQVAFIIQK